MVIEEQDTEVGGFDAASQTAELTVRLIAIEDILVEVEAMACKRPASVA